MHPQPVTIPLETFVAQHWDYRPGDHVTILGPNGWGKTHLGFRLMDATARPSLPAINMVMKLRDETVLDWHNRLRLRMLTAWPPPYSPFRPPVRGHTVWPLNRHGKRAPRRVDPLEEEASLYYIFREVMLDTYSRGNRILFADEIAGILNDIQTPKDEEPLTRYARPIWTRGRTHGAGLWAASQRPVDIPLHAYTNAIHLFLGNDPDARGRQRYSEIGGVDPAMVRAVTAGLPQWHWLYIRRRGMRFAIISP